ncbi:MAG: hypothetical protein WBD50_07720 [Candidatus Rhabdochlamydia sp.]
MSSFANNLLRRYEHDQEVIMAHIHAIVSTVANNDLELQAIRERIHQISINEIHNESGTIFQVEQISDPSDKEPFLLRIIFYLISLKRL